MADSPANDALRELLARGLLAAAPEPQLLPVGNVDRHVHAARESWQASLPDGRKVRLVLGPDLGDLARRHATFAAAASNLVPAPVFHQTLQTGEAFACAFFTGDNLEVTARERPAAASAAFAKVCTALIATEQPSTETARLAEWQAWTTGVEARKFWTAEERQLLREMIWPRLYPLLAAQSPVLRWTNGDFTSGNILVAPDGDVRLIDCEFGGATHFFAEDAARFHSFSPAARDHPALFSAALPPVGPAWHLYFWLRQFVLEFDQNTAAYFTRVASVRLGVIRRLAECLLDRPLTGWSAAATPVNHAIETARWDNASLAAVRVTGWCHVPGTGLRRIVATQNDRLLEAWVPLDRPDVQAHFAGASQALASGFDWVISIQQRDDPIVLSALSDDNTLLPFHSFRPVDLPGRKPWLSDYPLWAQRYDPDPAPAAPVDGPRFSILLPVFNPPGPWLRACLDSVQRQHHPHWELQVVDDASTNPGVAAILRQFAATEPRAKIHVRPANGGIARATNEALAAATGEFVVLLDHDDLLRPHALAEFARALAAEPKLDALYSDEDKITETGTRLMPFFKPDFSPEFLLGVMYIGHALCVRTAVARVAGGFDPAFDGIQDYEFFLRVTEHTRSIGHVPRILYHWRQSAASSALHGNIKGDMDERQAQAVRAHLQRRGRTEKVALHGGHRLTLQVANIPRFEVIHAAPGADVLATLRRAAAGSEADILVLLAVEPKEASAGWAEALAGATALPDSGLCAPLLLSREGWVFESGRTSGGQPVMRGFDPAGDGYNGSLPCRREVDAVAPTCFAVRRELVPATTTENWAGFCARLRRSGLYPRVCPTARLQLAGGWQESLPAGGQPAAPNDFFNPHFDVRGADYSLAVPPPHLAPVVWHLDTPLASVIADGCVILRGWAFAADGRPLTQVRLHSGAITLAGVVGLPRPDVKHAQPDAPGELCGFEIRGTLPGGKTTLALEAAGADGTWNVLLQQSVDVRRRTLPLWLRGGTWQELMFFQMPGHAAYPPRRLKAESFPSRGGSSAPPRIVVVTPSYQQAQFLNETMRSVLEQPGVACDYVVQDGGSTDGSAAIIAARETGGRRPEAGSESSSSPASGLPPPASPRLLAWSSERDAGQADAIARGFAKTTGGPDDVMAWINSDDFYLPGALAFVADYFARHPEVDVVYGHRIVVDENSREIARWFLPKHDPEVLRLNDFVPQETMFWRRRVWDKVGGIDPSFKFAMDWDLLLRLQAAGAKIVRVPYFLACFRVHAAQKTSAQMHSTGRQEITRLRERTFGRAFPPQELEANPVLLRYLRRSAFIEFLWSLGWRSS